MLADGTFVRATDQADSDLLWAARGGGGGFGVVTALEFDLFPVSTVYAGKLAWDWTHAQRVLTAWGVGPLRRRKVSPVSPGSFRRLICRGFRPTSGGEKIAGERAKTAGRRNVPE